MSSHGAVANISHASENEEDEKAFEEYYESDYGKRKVEWLKSVTETRERRTQEMADALKPQTK